MAAAATIATPVFDATYRVAAVAYPRFLVTHGYAQRLRAIALAALAIDAIGAGLASLIGVAPRLAAELFFAQRLLSVIPRIPALTFSVACLSLSAHGFYILITFNSHSGPMTSTGAVGPGPVLYARRHQSMAAVTINQIALYLVE